MDRHPARRDPRGDRGEAPGSAGAPLPGGAPAAPDARRSRTASCCRTPTSSRSTSTSCGRRPTTGGGAGTTQHERIARPREGHRRVYVPRREEVVEVLAEHGMLPAIYFVFSRAGCDKSVRWLRGVGRLAHDPRRGATDPRARGDARRLDGRGGPRHARVLRVPRRAHRRHRRAPRGDAPDVQGDRRGAVRGRPREGGLRHRDAVAGHQHAREDGRDRGPVEVPGRAARDPHARRVHAAHGPGGPARDRRARPRGGALPAPGELRAGRDARRHAHVQPRLVVPALVQHGGEPRPQLHAGAGTPPAELVVRAVPRGPRGRGPRAASARRMSRRSRATATNMVCHLGDFDEYWGLVGEGPAAARGGSAGPRAAPRSRPCARPSASCARAR